MRAFLNIRGAALREAIITFVAEVSKLHHDEQSLSSQRTTSKLAVKLWRPLSENWASSAPNLGDGTNSAVRLQYSHIKQIEEEVIIGVFRNPADPRQFNFN